jgi:hypothetical protein
MIPQGLAQGTTMTEQPDGHESERAKRRDAAWKAIDDAAIEGLRSLNLFSADATKAAILLAGGSAATVLALLSQVIKEVAARPLIPALIIGLAFFVVALLLSAVATGFMFLSQSKFSAISSLKVKIEDYPWARHTAESARAQITGNALKWTAVTLVSIGYLLVTGGYWIVFRGLCRICWP